jgi:hypothetical protein
MDGIRALGLWRTALLASLGLSLPLGCGADTSDPTASASSLSPCTNSQDVGGGFERCAEGWLHRARVEVCESSVPRPDPVMPTPNAPPLPGYTGCASDADCAALSYGFCAPFSAGLPPRIFLTCQEGCVTDSDCAESQLCLCGSPVGTCVTATCRSDAECGEGRCAASTVSGGCSFDSVRFDCQTPDDECASDADCGGNLKDCNFAFEARRCSGLLQCGRPFLVGGGCRQSELEFGAPGAWAAASSPDLSQLEPRQRRELAEHWSRMALMEHASVAAFARFVLELLSLGAPAELVREAQQAMRDEVEHAELCFGLASAYAGQPLAPGPLAIDGALAARSPCGLVLCAFREACLGETEAAVEAQAALDSARDPAVKRVLARIAADEARHAELGYRFLQFALRTLTPRDRLSLGATLRRELEAATLRARADLAPMSEPTTAELAEHGLISASERARARANAIEQVAIPCTRALLTSSTRKYREEATA